MNKSVFIWIIIFIFGFHLNAMEHKEGDLRIGIVGAGPSGIMAAITLKNRGYNNVIVLEANDDVGEKVVTWEYKGHLYEGGGVIQAPDYALNFSLKEELGLEVYGTPGSTSYSESGNPCGMFEWCHKKWGLKGYFRLALEHAFFANYVRWNPKVFEPGFSNTPNEMLTNFEDFMKNQGMEAVLEAHRPIMVGCGYGYAEDKPAAYWIKLMKTFANDYPPYLFSKKPFFTSFSSGWQNLWKQAVAKKNIDVRLNTRVLAVKRTGFEGEAASRLGSIFVETSNGNFEFDKLIVSVPHLAMKFMDFDDGEKEIFSRIRTINYKVTLAEIDGLKKNQHLWLRKNSYKYDDQGQPNDGKPVLISSNQKQTNVYQVYQSTELDKSNPELRQIMEESIRSIKGRLVKIVREKMFTYFPHFDVDAFREGIPQNLSRLMGKKGTYYTGALMDFEIVERAAGHAKHMVEENFPSLLQR